jgi:hypothetical protein
VTTYAEFVSGLAGLEIEGVTRQFDYPPPSLNKADLPASFPLLPSGSEGALTFQAHGGWPTFKCELIIAYMPVAQSTQAENFAGAVALMDPVAEALRDAVGTFCKGKVTWDIRQTVVTVAGIDYWAVQATVVGHG